MARIQSFGSDIYAMLRQVSRTFALSIEQLPPVLRDIITIAYLLFRVADCIEDHPELQRQKKAELLRLWAQVLAGKASVEKLTSAIALLDAQDPEVAVAQNAKTIIERMHVLPQESVRILTDHVHATALGMARWQEHGPFVRDEAEMDDYMHEVAGRVGYLLTDIFCWYAPAIRRIHSLLMPLAREFGLALQTVNIIRGLKKDFERGWIFIPESLLVHEGLTRESFFSPENRAKAMRVIAVLAEKAVRHLRSGLTYITMLPRVERKIRLFCIWPLLFAAKTISISTNNPAVLHAEAKISRADVKRIVLYSSIFSWSNLCLKAYFNYLLKPVRI
ncbi:MAG: squalene/phytoene synthase family protein [Desulfobacterota bacterium]|nr:squalene/phytoene synthase family protein [Thermodesulfobacteriota bacterium]